MIKLRLGLILLFFLVFGCTRPETAAVVDISAAQVGPTAVPPSPLPPATLMPTNTPLPPAPTLTAVATAIPATATLQPPLIIAAAPEWQAAVHQALNQVADASQPWTLLSSTDPSADLAAGRAHLALSDGESGTLVYQEPIILSVPFTTEWEAVSLAEAQNIIATGHRLAIVQLWSELPAGSKALRVNGFKPGDDQYPLQKRLTLAAAPGFDTAVSRLAPFLQTALQPQPTVHLTAVGDIMLDRGPGFVIAQGNLAYPFAQVAHLLQTADVAIGNVESALGDVGEPAPKSYPFQAPPEAAAALASAGFDIVSLANNHGMDYGPEALLQALQLLQAQRVQPIGAGVNRAEAHEPYITTINGLTIAFLGYVNVPVEALTAFDVAGWDATESTPGLAWGEPHIVAADVTAVRDQVDLVVVVLHSGYEYIEEPSEIQAAISHTAIDAGADLVIGHHAHILQGIEYYNDGVIVYGLGNFVFEIDGDPNTAVLNVWLDRNGVREVELIPAIIQTGGQPRLAEEWEAKPILQNVYYLTRLLNSR